MLKIYSNVYDTHSDTMGNKGAFLVLKGEDLTPKITSYSAMVWWGGKVMGWGEVRRMCGDGRNYKCFQIIYIYKFYIII